MARSEESPTLRFSSELDDLATELDDLATSQEALDSSAIYLVPLFINLWDSSEADYALNFGQQP